ncbi:type II toxin-antitoxin system mRNA interferase toxin, RelE/StbE family [Serratia sp. DD3]|uniref:type II toxin-antitoxin system RelE/ParE family toxin n=1 Tax=Serratia sp. DD3 TaxID=1410619 RepID=UPI0003C50003|nr:type II toxin-antitoxin system mRNA interferase toxin, RelE/StbE family [Serratia sp. DD3]KEY57017.1 toxin RelE2 [Serratia sp. DD3]
MKVIWAPEAEQDREDIWYYIAEDNPEAALRMDTLFSEAADRLSRHPEIGRQGTIAGTRELIVHESYRLVYQIEDDAVWIIALVHTAQRWPPLVK